MSTRRAGRPRGSINRPDALKTGPKPKIAKQPITNHFEILPREPILDSTAALNPSNDTSDGSTDIRPHFQAGVSTGCQAVAETMSKECQTTVCNTHTLKKPNVFDKQCDFVSDIKMQISKSMVRPSNRAASGVYPFQQLMVIPKDPSIARFIPSINEYYLRPVFVFIPEFVWPHLFPKGRPPCPHCSAADEKVVVNNWIEPRQIILEDRCADLLGYRCHLD